ncbi:MAG: threonine ammonia-lyase [Peptostreptococcaceae bacterium]
MITINDIKKAQNVIKDVVRKTDLIKSHRLSNQINSNVYFKCENLQRTGSFKLRGASNKIYNLSEEEKQRGVIASSAGNHAQGVALSASKNNIKSIVVMPQTAPLAKVAATKDYGAEVIQEGLVYDDAYNKAMEIQKETNMVFLHPFDDEFVIAGQGTIGLEIYEQLDGNIDTVICPIGGGGLIAGVSLAIKSLNKNIKVIGVQTENIPSMKESIDNNCVTTAFKNTTIADGIAVKTPGTKTFEIIKDYVDEILTVSEEEIAQGILFSMENQKLLVEGSGAVCTAALISKKYIPKKDENVVCILSGGNVDINKIYRVIGSALYTEGRRFKFKTEIEDRPGGLAILTKAISDTNANILSANLTRLTADATLGSQTVEIVLETFNKEHVETIIDVIEKAGFKIQL